MRSVWAVVLTLMLTYGIAAGSPPVGGKASRAPAGVGFGRADEDSWIVVETPDYAFMWDASALEAHDDGSRLPNGVYYDRLSGRAYLWFGSANLHHAIAEAVDQWNLDALGLVHADEAFGICGRRPPPATRAGGGKC